MKDDIADLLEEIGESQRAWLSQDWHNLTLGQPHQWLLDVAERRSHQEWCQTFVQALKDFGLPDEWCEMHLDVNGQIRTITRTRWNYLNQTMRWLTRRLKQGESLPYPPHGVFSGESSEPFPEDRPQKSEG